jgi:phosphate transport system protein
MATDDAKGMEPMPRPGGERRDARKSLDELWKSVLSLTAQVEAALATSVLALRTGRLDLMDEVRSREKLVDDQDVHIERDCLRFLALHSPVASDLRRIVASLRIGRDLERMSDLADHMAKRAKKLTKLHALLPLPSVLEELADAAMDQVAQSLVAITAEDVSRARAVLAGERDINLLRRKSTSEIRQSILSDPDRVNAWLHLMNVARHLERIGDHAANLAENVIYMKEGQIIRHRRAGSDD